VKRPGVKTWMTPLMMRRTQMLACCGLRFAWVACSALALHAAGPGATPRTNQLQEALKWEVLSAPLYRSRLDWLVGRWRCVERQVLQPVPHFADYAWLTEMEFDEALISRSLDFEAGWKIIPICRFLTNSRGYLKSERGMVSEFYATNFCFDMPMPDVMLVRKGPGEKPEWFVFRHKARKDALLFQRVADKATGAPDGNASPQPVKTTIADLLSKGWSRKGQRVEVTGYYRGSVPPNLGGILYDTRADATNRNYGKALTIAPDVKENCDDKVTFLPLDSYVRAIGRFDYGLGGVPHGVCPGSLRALELFEPLPVNERGTNAPGVPGQNQK
jgi:hypothetical protein